MISGALLYIREDFRDVDKKTWLQVSYNISTVLFMLISVID